MPRPCCPTTNRACPNDLPSHTQPVLTGRVSRTSAASRSQRPRAFGRRSKRCSSRPPLRSRVAQRRRGDRLAAREPDTNTAVPSPAMLEALAMRLNHLNLTVTDVPATHTFLQKYFGLRDLGGNNNIAVLSDDNGLVLSL